METQEVTTTNDPKRNWKNASKGIFEESVQSTASTQEPLRASTDSILEVGSFSSDAHSMEVAAREHEYNYEMV